MNTTPLKRNMTIIIVLTLIGMGTVSYFQLKSIFEANKKEKLRLLDRQSRIILDLRDNAMEYTSEYMDLMAKNSIKEFMDYLREQNASPDTIDLKRYIIQNDLGYRMNDFYIIDTTGEIVNTSFRHDLGMNVYSTFGKKFETYMKQVFTDGDLHIDGFTIESKTHKLKKYAYQATPDRNYIVEFGAYSEEANILRNSVLKGMEDIMENDETILSVDIIPPAYPDYYSLYNTGLVLDDQEKELMDKLYESSDTMHITSEKNLATYYRIFPRPESKLYDKLLIRIVYDKTKDREALMAELRKEVILYAIGLLILLVALFWSTNKLSKQG